METEPNNNLDQAKTKLVAKTQNGVLCGHVEIQKYDSPPGVEKQNVVKLENLEPYVKSMSECGGFAEQCEMLKTGPLKTSEAGKRPGNKLKNRYSDLLPYDDSRVILQKVKNDPDSDYINASYIDGYNKPKAYICTQGPLDKTIIDFWRMIWQENVCKIVMISNIIENGKKKCDVYWPEAITRYGDITVSLLSEQVFVDYTIRTFHCYKSGKSHSRQLRQYHYTTWPDHTVPPYPLSIVMMLKCMKRYQRNSTAPIVMHCSAGVGRSGTAILLDASLDMIKSEGKVDVLGTLYKMRQQRNIVENCEQYTFVYRALIDYHFGDVTSNTTQGIILYYNKLRMMDNDTKKTGLQTQFEALSKLTPPLSEEKCISALKSENKSKNRSLDILPSEAGRPILKSGTAFTYINAVYVNGYGRADSYVVTQYPLPETINDFWQLVYDVESSVIVALNDFDVNDETSPVPWPESGTTYRGNFRIDHIFMKPSNGGCIRRFKLRKMDGDQKARKIRQYHLKGCKNNELSHPATENFVCMLSKVGRWQHKSRYKPVIVMCFNGCTMSGFYCAASFIRDQIRDQGIVDIFEAVRTVRSNRPSFVQTVNQYRWLYEVGCALISSKRSRC
uniref:protein-tyrosine-phosphatase n=1 Tax=Hadrurus spadix TaxID=141984 RepID=A0A1W7R9B2_9SCOR